MKGCRKLQKSANLSGCSGGKGEQEEQRRREVEKSVKGQVMHLSRCPLFVCAERTKSQLLGTW